MSLSAGKTKGSSLWSAWCRCLLSGEYFLGCCLLTVLIAGTIDRYQPLGAELFPNPASAFGPASPCCWSAGNSQPTPIGFSGILLRWPSPPG